MKFEQLDDKTSCSLKRIISGFYLWVVEILLEVNQCFDLWEVSERRADGFSSTCSSTLNVTSSPTTDTRRLLTCPECGAGNAVAIGRGRPVDGLIAGFGVEERFVAVGRDGVRSASEVHVGQVKPVRWDQQRSGRTSGDLWLSVGAASRRRPPGLCFLLLFLLLLSVFVCFDSDLMF